MQDYKLIIKFPQADFEAEVNQALKDGFELIGGVTTDHLHGWYCQAVAKYGPISSSEGVEIDSSDGSEAENEEESGEGENSHEEESVSLTHKKVGRGKKGGRK